MSASPTSRSLQALKAEGWTPSVVERWLSYARVRVDAPGFADILAVKGDVPGVLFVQACAAGDASKRLRKLLGVPAVRVALGSGNRVEVWAWRKSARTRRWMCNKTAVTLAMLDEQDAPAGDAQDDTVGQGAAANADSPRGTPGGLPAVGAAASSHRGKP